MPRVPALVLLLCAFAGCAPVPFTPDVKPSARPPDTPTTASTSLPRPPEAYIVTGEANGAPAGCDAQDVAQRVAALFDAISSGQPGISAEFFGGAGNGAFQWYSMTEVRGETPIRNAVLNDPRDLDAYFAGRARHAERLTLTHLQVNGWDADRALVHFGPVEFERTADDLGATGPLKGDGKGAYSCGTRAFIVLSLVSALP